MHGLDTIIAMNRRAVIRCRMRALEKRFPLAAGIAESFGPMPVFYGDQEIGVVIFVEETQRLHFCPVTASTSHRVL